MTDSASPATQQRWLFVLGGVLMVSWLLIAGVQLLLLDPHNATLESGHYLTYERQINTAIATAAAGVIIPAVLTIAWVLRKTVTDRRAIVFVRVTLGVMFLTGVLFSALVLVHMALTGTTKIEQTLELNGYTYHLARQTDMDIFVDRLRLYECSAPHTNCRLLYDTVDAGYDTMDLRIHTEDGKVVLAHYSVVIYERQPPAHQ